MAKDLSGDIESAATTPKRVETDDVEVEARPIRELIAADRHLKSETAARSKTRGLVMSKLAPPGTQ